MTAYPTPKTDKLLQVHRFITKEGLIYNDVITPWQKVIMETIITRKAPDGSGKNRIHIMAHTRYGKSLAVGAAVALRAAIKAEPWAIVAGTKEQAQIIMDHVIQFSSHDPILKALLVQNTDNIIKDRKKRTFITFANGGEVRAYTTGTDGSLIMGQGCVNVVQDESALISDNANSKVERMLGDNPHDNFMVKIGNPFHNNHFRDAFLDEDYFHINIDHNVGLEEGRLTEKFLEERRKKPNFSVLYQNLFPDEASMDEKGFLPMFTHSMLERAYTEPNSTPKAGSSIVGVDPADGGDNESVICKRWINVAEVVLKSTEHNSVTLAGEIPQHAVDSFQVNIDTIGVGSGTVNTLKYQSGIKRLIKAIRAGDKVPEKTENRELFANLRAYMFWQAKLWLEQGGKLVRDEGFKQLLAVKYKTNTSGRIQIISKDELHKRGVHDLGVADAFSFTFAPKKLVVTNNTVKGGVDPLRGING